MVGALSLQVRMTGHRPLGPALGIPLDGQKQSAKVGSNADGMSNEPITTSGMGGLKQPKEGDEQSRPNVSWHCGDHANDGTCSTFAHPTAAIEVSGVTCPWA